MKSRARLQLDRHQRRFESRIARENGDHDDDERSEVLKIHRPYDESDDVIRIALNSLGARRIPDPTTAGDFCRRLDCAEFVDALQTAINEAQLRVWQTRPQEFFAGALIDADGTSIDASDSTKEPTSRGRGLDSILSS